MYVWMDYHDGDCDVYSSYGDNGDVNNVSDKIMTMMNVIIRMIIMMVVIMIGSDNDSDDDDEYIARFTYLLN